MANLVYAAICSLDGYIEDETGAFDWSAPDAEVHAFINDLERTIGTYLYGRRLYEVMRVWQTMDSDEPVVRDFADVWRAADKVVFSTTLAGVDIPRTRLEHRFDPDVVRALKASATSDLSVGGPNLAAQAIAAGLVDECHLFVNPVSVGGGKPALPTGARWPLELIDEHRFGGGVVHLHYRAV